MRSASQLELFSSRQEDKVRRTTGKVFMFGYLFGHEKVILIIIGFIITGIISFSLGIQRGKSLMQFQSSPFKNSPVDTVDTTQSSSHKIPQTPQQKTIEKETVIKPPENKQPTQQSYTIQVATYQSKAGALKEAEALRKKGLSPIILSKGRYNVLCVGNFSNPKTAQMVLSELKKRYRDCFVRRM
ncbi:MAG: SPOR domain-containing protein [Candidatus Omnitrophica bacterium]|nr:SPOR domain-containing protein [Candidatus Omnitrophota bacterium]